MEWIFDKILKQKKRLGLPQHWPLGLVKNERIYKYRKEECWFWVFESEVREMGGMWDLFIGLSIFLEI